jgi:hypothetical protein
MSAARGGGVRVRGTTRVPPAPTLKSIPSPPRQNWPWPVQIIRLLVAFAIAVAVSTALVVFILVGARPI